MNHYPLFSETVVANEPDTVHPSERLSVTFAPETIDTEQEVTAFKLDMMGANLETVTGSAIHDLIAKTWTSIFTTGLPKETRLALQKKYPVPENLPLAKAPTLNIEVRHAIPSTSVTRDEYYLTTQGMVEAAIAAQANLMTELLKPEEQWNTKYIFESASDAGRLFSHVQHHMSKARRALIVPMLTPSAKNALDSSPIDRQLFGEQYLNKMREAAAADKLVKSLTTLSGPSKPGTSGLGKSQFPPQQGNSRAFAFKQTSRRMTKVPSRPTRPRSNSRTRIARPRP